MTTPDNTGRPAMRDSEKIIRNAIEKAIMQLTAYGANQTSYLREALDLLASQRADPQAIRDQAFEDAAFLLDNGRTWGNEGLCAHVTTDSAAAAIRSLKMVR